MHCLDSQRERPFGGHQVASPLNCIPATPRHKATNAFEIELAAQKIHHSILAGSKNLRETLIVLRFGIIKLSIGLIAATVLGSPASADDSGMASMHTWRSERGITCLADHAHTGFGVAATKRAARKKAIVAWESFTAWEYGTDWARYRSAGSKSVEYLKMANGWRAGVDGRPCNRRKRTKRRR